MGFAALRYADDNDDSLPESLFTAVDEGYIVRETLVCPSDKHPMIIGGDTECSYFYVGRLSIGDMLGVADAGRFVIAYEKNPGHTDYGYYYRNALCLDGHIEELDPEWMSDSLEKVKAMDAWPDLPEERKQEIEAFYTLEQTE